MFGLGAGEILIILVFALIFIGPKKLPELARTLGKSFRELQKAKDDFTGELMNQDHDSDSTRLTGVELNSGEEGTEEDTNDAHQLCEEETVADAKTSDLEKESERIDDDSEKADEEKPS